MKKLITKSIFTFALLGTFLLGGVFAIDVINTGYSNSCNPNQSITRNYYLTDNNYTTNPSDGFTAVGTDALLFSNGTTVGIWRNGIIAQNSCNSWLRSSNAAKQGISNTLAIFNDDGCRFNIPNYTKVDSASIDAQIQYTIAYRNTPGNPSVGQTTNKFYYRTGGSSYWTCYPGGEHKNNRQDCPDVTLNVGELRTHVGECINYRIFRCGDGLVNGYNGSTSYNNGNHTEQCDPNDPNHSGRGNGGCSASCQPINNTQPPVCNTAYSGTHYVNNPIYPNWLNAGMNLCSIGTVSNFTNRWNGYGHVGHYSWTCSNSAGSINCQANQQRCGDGLVNGNEACDPNDPTHSGWNNNGYSCNASCQLVPPPTQNPQCNTAYSGTHYVNNPIYPNWLNAGMNLCSIGTVSNFTNRWNGYGHVGHYGWTCSNSAGSVNCQANQQRCGDGLVNGNEACDPNDPTHSGWNNNGYSCNASCQLVPPPTQNPQCNTAYSGTHYVNNPIYPNWLNAGMNLCSIGTVSNFTNRWNGYGHVGHYGWTCSNSAGSVNCQANQQRCGDGLINGNEDCDPNDPTHSGWNNNGYSCNASCQLYIPGSPIPYLLKQQKTGGMANFTSNQINVGIGETITYKVNFGNSGTVAATGEVWDILPPCVNYLTSSIHLPNGVAYNGPITTPYLDQTMVKYKDFRLQPGQGGYMLIQAQIRGTGTHGTISCQNITSYLNTGYFKFIGGNTLSSQVIAIRPQAPHLTITKELLTAGDMTAGSTVAYKITLRNDGNATYYNAYILDILPNAIQYQTSSIQNITNYLFEEGTTGNNEHYIKYYNFNLTAGHSAIVYLTGVLKQGFNFNQTVNCAFTSGAYDCEEFPLTPVPFVQKYQKIGNDNNPNSNGWTTHTLNVELGQYISYRIDFGNLGNKAATGEVKDILPQCVQYVNAYLIGASGNGPTYYPNTHTVRFKNIPLAAGQTAHMMVVGKIKQEDGCQNVYSYLNTGAFHFLGSSWGYSQVLAERPNLTDVEITKTVDKNKVKSGDTVIYTITYKNNGPEILQSYTIVDYWPNEQLEFAGVLEPSTPAPIWESENIVKRYFDTPLGVNEQRQIKIKGIVR